MKKILIAVLVLLLLFALIRITTSTYENMVRKDSAYVPSATGIPSSILRGGIDSRHP